MTANRSLDEFTGGEDDAAEEPTSAPAPDGSQGAVDARAEADEDVAPDGDGSPASVASTYRWIPGGAPCDACGDSVQERWRADDGLVCLDCKEW